MREDSYLSNSWDDPGNREATLAPKLSHKGKGATMAQIRRLPIYLVLDVSGSMTGQPIESVRQGLRSLVSDLQGDPTCLETTYLSVITYADDAYQKLPLTEIPSYVEPNLIAGGSTNFGKGLELLEKCVESEVVKTEVNVKGDYKPMIFIMTDGQPTDQYKEIASRIKNKRLGTIIGCAAGAGANVSTLQEVTEIVVKLETLEPNQLKNFFKWVSKSVKIASVAINQAPGGQTAGVTLPPPPPGINLVI